MDTKIYISKDTREILFVPERTHYYVKVYAYEWKEHPVFHASLIPTWFSNDKKEYEEISEEALNSMKSIREALDNIWFYISNVEDSIEAFEPNNEYSARISYVYNPEDMHIGTIVEHQKGIKEIIISGWNIHITPKEIRITNYRDKLDYEDCDTGEEYPVKELNLMEKVLLLNNMKLISRLIQSIVRKH